MERCGERKRQRGRERERERQRGRGGERVRKREQGGEWAREREEGGGGGIQLRAVWRHGEILFWARPIYRGTSLTRKRLPPKDHHGP